MAYTARISLIFIEEILFQQNYSNFTIFYPFQDGRRLSSQDPPFSPLTMGMRLSKRKPKEETSSSSPQNNVNDKDRAMLDLKRARDKLRRFRSKLDADSEALESKARMLIRNKAQDKAMFVLKLRKYKKKEAENVEGQLSKVLEMIQTINWEEQNTTVLRALQSGTKALNKMHDELPLEQVESILENNEAALERQASITEALRDGLDAQDDEELAEEYASLLRGVEEKEATILPDAPTTKPEVAALNLPAAPSTPAVASEAAKEKSGPAMAVAA